jgi:DNA (cytosine-5)-methyltransferase 1
VDPVKATKGRKVGLMWLSPDCKHFSKAKGGKPVEKKIRGLAWIAVRWAKALGKNKPRVIAWRTSRSSPTGDRSGRQPAGPDEEGPDLPPLREAAAEPRVRGGLAGARGGELWRADDRKRLFLVARCDGEPIVWPEATHGKGRELRLAHGGRVHRLDIPCPSIFERERPLAENTLKRIARRCWLVPADQHIAASRCAPISQ